MEEELVKFLVEEKSFRSVGVVKINVSIWYYYYSIVLMVCYINW